MTIDLGDVSAPPPSGSWSAQVGGARPLALVAVALAALALGGSAVPAPQIRTVLVTDELPGAFALSRSALFTTGYVGARAQVRRYPLTGPSPGWTTELTQPVGNVELAEAAGVLVVSSPEIVPRRWDRCGVVAQNVGRDHRPADHRRQRAHDLARRHRR